MRGISTNWPVNWALTLGKKMGDNLEKCPRCDYSMRGLPTVHRCPECGLEVDLRWKVFGGRTGSAGSRSLVRLGSHIATLAVSGVVLVYASYMLARYGAGPFSWIGGVVVAVLFAFFFRYLIRRRKNFVAVGPKGVVAYVESDRLYEFDWKRIKGAEYRNFEKSVALNLEGELFHLHSRTFFPGGVWEAEPCARYINRLASEWGSDVEGEDER